MTVCLRSIRSAAAGRCRRDAYPLPVQTDQRAGKGLLEPPSAATGALRQGLVKRRQQSLDFSQLRWTLMAESIDRTQQEPQPDFLRQRRKRLRVESLATRLFGRGYRFALERGGLAIP